VVDEEGVEERDVSLPTAYSNFAGEKYCRTVTTRSDF